MKKILPYPREQEEIGSKKTKSKRLRVSSENFGASGERM